MARNPKNEPPKGGPVKVPAPKPSKKGKRRTPGGFFPGGMTGNIISTVLIFLILMSVYTLIVNNNQEDKVSLSQVAGDVKAGVVSTIEVSGNSLTLTYADGAEKKSMKDPDQGLPE